MLAAKFGNEPLVWQDKDRRKASCGGGSHLQGEWSKGLELANLKDIRKANVDNYFLSVADTFVSTGDYNADPLHWR